MFLYLREACMNCTFDMWMKPRGLALYLTVCARVQLRHEKRLKMGKKRALMFSLALGLFVFCVSAAERHQVNAKTKQISVEVHKKLKLLNKRGVKTIKSEDGDIIDCVDIYKQPAFDHPALRNHKIQMRPIAEAPSPSPSPSSDLQNDRNSSQLVSQIWQRSGSCPDGTIPIRRIRKQDLLRTTALENFGKKMPVHSSYSPTDDKGTVNINITRVELRPRVNRSAAVLLTTGYSYIGAQGDINIWTPRVESPGEFTTAQIWLKNGPGEAFESVESGWVVNPKVYGNGASRLFVYWTKDSYKSSGCFDLTCPGFVQTNKDIALGMVLVPVSSEMGPQYQTTFSIAKEPSTGNWWVRIGQNVPVGYFPGELFYYLTHGAATLVEWGGEVFSSKVKQNHPHTATGMGSGNFASGKMGKACYVKQVRIIDYSMQLKYPEWVGTSTDEEYCYSALNYAPSLAQEPVFYFGGPGRNPPYCP